MKTRILNNRHWHSMVISILFPAIIFAQNPETVTDTEGNSYSVISIGEQVWMKENLRVSRYRNGDAILTGLPDSSWNKTLLGAWSVYNNDSSMNRIFGKLYNWYAVADPRGLCPSGWHVPSDKDWIKLEMHLGLPEKDLNKPGRRGAKQNVAGKMQSTGRKSDGSGYWKEQPEYANNESGFTGLPGGNRSYKGHYWYMGESGDWWTSSEASSKSAAWYRLLDVHKRPYRDAISKNFGFSVRCIKD